MIKKLKFVIILFIISCSQSVQNKTPTNNVLQLRNSLVKRDKTSDTTGFLSNCDLLMSDSYQGALQGTNSTNDSIGYLCFTDCYTCPETYELIFVYKGGIEVRKAIGYDSLGNVLRKGCNNNFSNFDCYAFVLPQRDPEKQEDVHAMNIDFPVTVRVYKRINSDNWKYIQTRKVKTFEEYASLQFKTIYGQNK